MMFIFCTTKISTMGMSPLVYDREEQRAESSPVEGLTPPALGETLLPEAGTTKGHCAYRASGTSCSGGARPERELRAGQAPSSMRSREQPRGRHLGWQVRGVSSPHSRTEPRELRAESE